MLKNRFAFLGAAAAVTAATIGLSANFVQSQSLSGTIRIDGSSTVFPITEAVAEEFQGTHSEVRVPVGVSGTGGGFKKFCVGETDISDASRQIKQTEQEKCAANGIDYIEIPVAYDAITVVVHPENTWATQMSVEQLKTLWEPQAEGEITMWSDMNSSWPNQEISLYGPGTDSGTFDYFTEAIVGEEDASRADYTASEDDNVLVLGVAEDKYALGYFGYSYYYENRDKLQAVAVNGVKPSQQTVESGQYSPLSRPLYIYVNKESLERPEVKAFVEFYLNNAPTYVNEVGYVPLSETTYSAFLEDL
ncbi:PstS family phosphate ABC transporter substrate-binding protein [Geitlerinema sp. PCC 9228]|jgi:phosphate transport system substrate-binding protein|uniref:PstS family phosphate ABC transporter substrate-binding protein n=1 Tax=Geitlerinema sp. PCC 9228 TaxID=111611 RepID=UPI0008F9CFE3|nr:PstS family phosphate ABC transporter substrate-binding protein [Geitlerinema sp. PCC 9228]